MRAQIGNLEERLKIKEKMEYEKPYYWIRDGESKDGPFCQRCYDTNKNLLRLQGGNNDVWVCYECKRTYYGPNYKAPEIRTSSRRSLRSWLDDY